MARFRVQVMEVGGMARFRVQGSMLPATSGQGKVQGSGYR